jgi:hypothetical protein
MLDGRWMDIRWTIDGAKMDNRLIIAATPSNKKACMAAATLKYQSKSNEYFN